jgi:hypothetical protein
MELINGNGGHEPEEKEDPPAGPKMVCGVAIFINPGGVGIHVEPIQTESCERVPTPTDLRTIATELMHHTQAIGVMGLLNAQAQHQPQAKRGSLHVPGLDAFRGLFRSRG